MMLRMTSAGKKQALKTVKELDAFPKVPESYVETSATGGSVSILTFVFIAILVISEIQYYMETNMIYEYEVDKEYDAKMKMNFDITVAAPCEALGADVVDATGENKHGHGEVQEERTWFQLSPRQQTHHEMMVELNGYLREQYHSLHSFLWSSAPSFAHSRMPEREENPTTPPDACRLHGSMVVNKVAGNFHITGGKSLPMMGGGHAHIQFMGGSAVNYSHRIDHFSFGDYTGGRINPLDTDQHISESDRQLYQYFIKIVPTHVETRRADITTYQFSVTERERAIDHTSGSHGIPGIFFKYDLSSFRVRVREEHRPIAGFLVRLCGIVGGIFACSGIINAFVNAIVNYLCCRFKLAGSALEAAPASAPVTPSSPATPLVPPMMPGTPPVVPPAAPSTPLVSTPAVLAGGGEGASAVDMGGTSES